MSSSSTETFDSSPMSSRRNRCVIALVKIVGVKLRAAKTKEFLHVAEAAEPIIYEQRVGAITKSFVAPRRNRNLDSAQVT